MNVPSTSVCACGHDRTHPSVTPESRYGPFAMFWLLMGATATPKEVRFRCRRCGQVVETSRQPDVLRQHR